MFVPVNCTNCGKPFQVPETALAKLAPCPWCQEIVTALPVANPKADAAQEPLSLDDAPEPKQTLSPVPPVSAPVRRPFNLVLLITVGLVVAIAVTAVTVGALRRKSGYFVNIDWRTFHTPDSSCSIDLLGTPVEEVDAPGSRRYISEGWYSGTRTWIGWKDLSPAEMQMATGPEAWQLLRPALLNPEKERLKNAFGGNEAEGGGTKSFQPLVVEYRQQTPDGLLVERAIIKTDGPRPRAYFIGIVGKRINADGPELNRLVDSFRIND